MTGCGGLSGEHIQLCAEGARHENAESLRQTDGDKQNVIFYFLRWFTVPEQSKPGLLLFFCNSKNYPFAIWWHLLLHLCVSQRPQYTKYSDLSET